MHAISVVCCINARDNYMKLERLVDQRSKALLRLEQPADEETYAPCKDPLPPPTSSSPSAQPPRGYSHTSLPSSVPALPRARRYDSPPSPTPLTLYSPSSSLLAFQSAPPRLNSLRG